MNSLPLVLLIAGTAAALVQAKGAKRKTINALIILGFVIVGFVVGALLGSRGGNAENGGRVAVIVGFLLGGVGGFARMQMEKRRARRLAGTNAGKPEPNVPDAQR